MYLSIIQCPTITEVKTVLYKSGLNYKTNYIKLHIENDLKCIVNFIVDNYVIKYEKKNFSKFEYINWGSWGGYQFLHCDFVKKLRLMIDRFNKLREKNLMRKFNFYLFLYVNDRLYNPNNGLRYKELKNNFNKNINI